MVRIHFGTHPGPLGRCLSRLVRRVDLMLPSLYFDVTRLLVRAFAPRLDVLCSAPGFRPHPEELGLPPLIQEALSVYEDSVWDVRRFASKARLPALELFDDPFCLPFCL